FSSRRRHTRSYGDWSSDVCSSDLVPAAEAYAGLKRRFTKWDAILTADARTLQRHLKPLGLWRIRARYLRAILRRIRRDFGECDRSEERRVGKECRSRWAACR